MAGESPLEAFSLFASLGFDDDLNGSDSFDLAAGFESLALAFGLASRGLSSSNEVGDNFNAGLGF